MAIRPDQFRKALGQWPSGVTVVTTVGPNGQRFGLTASSFSSVSLDPPLVSVCIAAAAATHDRIAGSSVFGVSVLSADHVEVGKRFAGALPAEDRFAGSDWVTASTGAPLLADAQAWLDCTVTAAHPAGDHTIFVGEVRACDTPRPRAPLLYHDRAWGQFADILPERVSIRSSGQPHDGVVVEVGATTPVDDVPEIVAEAVAAGAQQVCLADVAGYLSPLDVRAMLRATLPVSGAVPLWLRLSDRLGFGSANVLTALKSGGAHFEVSDAPGDVVTAGLVASMCARMGIAVDVSATDAFHPPQGPGTAQGEELGEELGEAHVGAAK